MARIDIQEAEAVKAWFATPVADGLTRHDIVSVRQIEVAAGVPAYTLQKYLNGRNATFPAKHLYRLVKVLALIGYQPVNIAEHYFL